MSKIAVIDADLIGRRRHNFPNLTCMKISGYHKNLGDDVTLKLDYDDLGIFDKVYIAKVFTDTYFPDGGLFGKITDLPNVEIGGTGFYYDKSKPLPLDIEHTKPDYHLYDKWISIAPSDTKLKYYKDYSIGFLTRGCFRHCPFCVNRQSSKVYANSPLFEFLDTTRKKICLLDDNFFGYADWEILLRHLIKSDYPFQFKQGLDVRLLDDKKAELLFKARYDGDYIFAFDDWHDAEIIFEKLKLIRKHYKVRRKVKFYVLCAYDRSGKYDKEFWKWDLNTTCRRINLLRRFDCLVYVMRFEKYRESPYKQIYNNLAAYANQPQFWAVMPFGEFAEARNKNVDSYTYELERVLLSEVV